MTESWRVGARIRRTYRTWPSPDTTHPVSTQFGPETRPESNKAQTHVFFVFEWKPREVRTGNLSCPIMVPLQSSTQPVDASRTDTRRTGTPQTVSCLVHLSVCSYQIESATAASGHPDPGMGQTETVFFVFVCLWECRRDGCP